MSTAFVFKDHSYLLTSKSREISSIIIFFILALRVSIRCHRSGPEIGVGYAGDDGGTDEKERRKARDDKRRMIRLSLCDFSLIK